MIGLAVASLLMAAAPPPFVDLATPFDDVATRSVGEPPAQRVAGVRAAIDPQLPGLYPPDRRTEGRIVRALDALPPVRPAYLRAIARFPAALDAAATRFRRVFPRFRSPLPIYLVHSLGIRDGGSDYLEPGHRKVMLFGADMIAQLHDDDSLAPFLAHELFHLEHGRFFADCDQLWCGVWQEGLAVHATAKMMPGSSDHDLLLDQPTPIRARVDAGMGSALCHLAAHFDDPSPDESALVLTGGQHPEHLPARFGYYVGMLIAAETGRPLRALTRLDDKSARPIVRAALVRLLKRAKAPCSAPPARAAITHRAPRAA